MDIPIVILNKDRLTTTERLCDQLVVLGYTNIHILDMSSTYQPLLEWYKVCPYRVQVVPNDGHKALWEKGYITQFRDHKWIVVTDSDIELDIDTPKGFIEQMVQVATEFTMNKVGLGIRIGDITNSYLKKIVYPIEIRYWYNRIHHDLTIYNAPVDTTFCIVKPQLPFQYQALRICDWPIKHCDWYTDWNNMTEEQQFYMDNADENISSTKQHYLKYLVAK